MRSKGRTWGQRRRIVYRALALLLVTSVSLASEARAASVTIGLAPSGGDDTPAFQAALDAASSGPHTTIELAPGTFRIGRQLLSLNSNVTIRGAGRGVTEVIADGSVNPSGLFRLEPLGDNGTIQLFRTALLFQFKESDRDVTGQPLDTQRSLRVVIEDLTLGARGQTEGHFDVSANTDTQRMFSLVWIEGFRGGWTNSQGLTPADTGEIDAEHALLSTVRASFNDVHFDGRNRGRADNETGGPFDSNPDVRNALGVEGGFALIQPPPDPIFFFKPINAELLFSDCVFSSIPGQAGIFAPQMVGRDDSAWTVGPDAVPGSLVVRDSVFRDVFIPVLLPDVSATDVSVRGSVLQSSLIGLLVSTNAQSTDGGVIGYPASAPSQLTVEDSSLENNVLASVLVDELFGPPLVDVNVKANEFLLAGASQAGITGFSVDRAQLSDNHFHGQGYAGIVGVDSTDWRINDADLCELDIPPSALSAFGFPPNDGQAPIVLLNSTGFRVKDSECASLYQLPEDPSNAVDDDED